MSAVAESQGARVAGFRRRLLVATMIVVTIVTLLGLYVGERRLVQRRARGRRAGGGRLAPGARRATHALRR